MLLVERQKLCEKMGMLYCIWYLHSSCQWCLISFSSSSFEDKGVILSCHHSSTFHGNEKKKDPISGAKCQNISLIPMLKWSPMKSQPSNLLICCRLHQTCAWWLFQKTLSLLEGGNCFKLIHRWQSIELWQLKEVYNYITIYAAMELLETHLYHLFQCRQPPFFIPNSAISFSHHITWSEYSGYHCWTKQ